MESHASDTPFREGEEGTAFTLTHIPSRVTEIPFIFGVSIQKNMEKQRYILRL